MIAAIICTIALQPAPVSYEIAAKRLPVVLSELEAKLQRKLTADAAFKNEVLVIRTRNIPADDLLERIADAAVGKWELEKGTLTLRPDQDRRWVEEDRRSQLRLLRVQALLDRLRAESQTPFDRPYLEEAARVRADINSQTHKAYLKSPNARLLSRILLEIGAQKLVTIEPGQRVVFSSHPNRRQIAFPDRERIWSAFLSESAEYDRAKEAINSLNLDSAYSSKERKGTDPALPRKLEKVLFAFGDLAGPYASATVITQYNKDVYHGYIPLVPALPVPTHSAPLEPLASVELATETRELGAIRGGLGMKGYERAKPRSALWRALRNPELIDPLTFGSEAILAIASAKNKNLVGLLPDSIFGEIWNDKPTLRSCEVQVRQHCKWKGTGDWLVLTPLTPVEARMHRDDRAAIGKMVRSPRIDFVARGEFLLKSYPYQACLGGRVAACLNKDLTSTSFATEGPLLRFFAALSPRQRQSGKVPVKSLTPSQRILLERLVLDRPWNFFDFREGAPLIYDPTEIFPNGITDDKVLEISDLSQPSVQALGSNPPFSDEVVSENLRFVALEIFWAQNPQFSHRQSDRERLVTFEPKIRRDLKIKLAIQEGKQLIFDVSDFESVGPPGKATELPKPHSDIVAAELAKIQQQAAAGNPPRRPGG